MFSYSVQKRHFALPYKNVAPMKSLPSSQKFLQTPMSFWSSVFVVSASYTESSDEDDGISPREKQQVGNIWSQKPAYMYIAHKAW